jgi:hypothetical protein
VEHLEDEEAAGGRDKVELPVVMQISNRARASYDKGYTCLPSYYGRGMEVLYS